MPYVPSAAVRRTSRLLLAGAVTLVVAACSSDDAVGPRPAEADAAARFTVTGVPGLPPLHSNRIKYRDQGRKPGTGRAGSAQVSVRALYGHDQATLTSETFLEVTTGTLDNGGAAPGKLTKLQVKHLDASGRLLGTLSLKPAGGGYAQYVLPPVPPGNALQVTAHVTGIDKGRTGVVTVLEQVKYRPDLVLVDVSVPERAPPNVPVTISALIAEQNGDVGARADCVLYVDNVEVDRARDIWVDAGSRVSCALTHAFPSEGSPQYRVAVQSVTPGDWDPDNNAASGFIRIRNLQRVEYDARAEELERRFHADRTWQVQRFAAGTNALLHTSEVTETDDLERNEQRGEHVLWLPAELQFPLARLEMEHVTNGSVLATSTATGVAAQWGDSFDGPHWGFRYSCAVDYTDGTFVTHLYLEVCALLHYVIDPAGTRHETRETVVQNFRWAGEVTFLSRGFLEVRYGDGTSDTDSWVNNFVQQAGPVPLPPLGATYTMRLTIQGGGAGATLYSNTAAVVLDQPHVPWWVEAGLGTGSTYHQPEQCTSSRFDASQFYELWRVCDTIDAYEVGRTGRLTNLPSITP